MEEHSNTRIEDCPKRDCGVDINNAAFSWGFKVSETQDKKIVEAST